MLTYAVRLILKASQCRILLRTFILVWTLRHSLDNAQFTWNEWESKCCLIILILCFIAFQLLPKSFMLQHVRLPTPPPKPLKIIFVTDLCIKELINESRNGMVLLQISFILDETWNATVLFCPALGSTYPVWILLQIVTLTLNIHTSAPITSANYICR